MCRARGCTEAALFACSVCGPQCLHHRTYHDAVPSEDCQIVPLPAPETHLLPVLQQTQDAADIVRQLLCIYDTICSFLRRSGARVSSISLSPRDLLVIRRKQSGSGNGEWTFDLRLAPAALLRLAAEAEKEDGEETEKHEQDLLSLPELLLYLITSGASLSMRRAPAADTNGAAAATTNAAKDAMALEMEYGPLLACLEQFHPTATDLVRYVTREMLPLSSGSGAAGASVRFFSVGQALQHPFFWDPITRLRLIVQIARLHHENHGVLTQALRAALAAEEVESKYTHDWSVRFEPALYAHLDQVRGQHNQGPYLQTLESLLRFIHHGQRQASAALLSAQLRRPGGPPLLLATEEPQLTAYYQASGLAELWVANQVQYAVPFLLLDLLRAVKTKPIICRYLRRCHEFSHIQRWLEI